MPRGSALLLAALLLAAALGAPRGLAAPAKDRRGWTLNSAGYLLGPHAIDNHRSFHDKHGLAGKRHLQPEEEVKPGSFDRPLPDSNVVRTIIEFLTFLHLKVLWESSRTTTTPSLRCVSLEGLSLQGGFPFAEAGALDSLPWAASSEEAEQP